MVCFMFKTLLLLKPLSKAKNLNILKNHLSETLSSIGLEGVVSPMFHQPPKTILNVSINQYNYQHQYNPPLSAERD